MCYRQRYERWMLLGNCSDAGTTLATMALIIVRDDVQVSQRRLDGKPRYPHHEFVKSIDTYDNAHQGDRHGYD